MSTHMTPVSYTHLDVYKRQSSDLTGFLRPVRSRRQRCMSTAAIPGANAHRLSRVALLLLLALFLAATALSLRGPYLPFEDDSYIFLRYSRHIAAGAGPVWNCLLYTSRCV